MQLEKCIRVMAGSFVLISLVLYYFISPYWLLLALLVGLNLIQSAFTGFCPAEKILSKWCGKCCCGGGECKPS